MLRPNQSLSIPLRIVWKRDHLFKTNCETFCPVDTRRKLNVQKTFRKRPGRLMNVLWTFNLRPVSTGWLEQDLGQWFCTLTLRKPFSKFVSRRKRERESLKFQWVENITKHNSGSAFDQANIWVNLSTFILQAAAKTHFGRYESKYLALHKKWNLPSKVFSVNVTKCAWNCEFAHVYWRNL